MRERPGSLPRCLARYVDAASGQTIEDGSVLTRISVTDAQSLKGWACNDQ